MSVSSSPLPFFYCTATATPEIYTLSLHDALPIYPVDPSTLVAPLKFGLLRATSSAWRGRPDLAERSVGEDVARSSPNLDRKSTRLNSSHITISYAVFCLKKKTTRQNKT